MCKNSASAARFLALPSGLRPTGGVYRPRHPENRPFHRGRDDDWEEFQRGYEVWFEKLHGPLRTAVRRAVDRFLKCGILHCGCARLRGPDCQKNRSLAYSCRTRQFCPSCAGKRVAAFGDPGASSPLGVVAPSTSGPAFGQDEGEPPTRQGTGP